MRQRTKPLHCRVWLTLASLVSLVACLPSAGGSGETAVPAASDSLERRSYLFEAMQGNARANQLLRAVSPSPDSGVQQLFARVGRKVLERWPYPRRGYRYDFQVLHFPDPMLLTYPAGHVFITDSLLSLFRDDLPALECVIAHEVHHIESRHGTVQFRANRLTPDSPEWRRRRLIDRMVTVAERAIKATGVNPLIKLTGRGDSLRVFDYEPSLEREADNLALLYADRYFGSSAVYDRGLERVLGPMLRQGREDSLQALVRRERAMRAVVRPLPASLKLVGRDSAGNEILRVSPLAQVSTPQTKSLQGELAQPSTSSATRSDRGATGPVETWMLVEVEGRAVPTGGYDLSGIELFGDGKHRLSVSTASRSVFAGDRLGLAFWIQPAAPIRDSLRFVRGYGMPSVATWELASPR